MCLIKMIEYKIILCNSKYERKNEINKRITQSSQGK